MNFFRLLRHGMTITLLAIAGAGLSGCAGVTFYSDAKLENRTGIPIYAPKPYLLVSRTGAKDKPVEVTVVYLSDPNKVIYAKPRSGFGSSNLTLALANGQMTSFGQQTDTKLPELITSLGGLITSRAIASKTEAEAEKILSGIGTEQGGVSTVEAGKQIAGVANDMSTKSINNGLQGLTDTELQTVKSVAQALTLAGKNLSDPANAPSAPQHFETVKAQIKTLSELPAPTASTPRDNSLQIVQAWTKDLQKIIASAQPEKEAPPTFELYEIIQGSGATTLRRVNP